MQPSGIQSQHYGRLPHGQAVNRWTLTGVTGLSLECLTLGATITSLRVPVPEQDRSVDVVLSLPSLDHYLSDHAYLGAMVGRVAGRVRDAKLNICGNEARLSANEGKNHLHGGVRAMSKALWEATPIRKQGHPALELHYYSPAGEEGYPGSIDICVTYTLTEDNALSITTAAEADELTVLSLTNHSYFNLSGGAEPTIHKHFLSVASDTYYPTDEAGILSHIATSLAGRPEDLRRSDALANILPRLPWGHGEAYALQASHQAMPAATLSYSFSPAEGKTLQMLCSTTQTCLQTYTASGFTGHPYPRHAGLCLECQGLPNLTDAADPRNILLHPGKPLTHVTTYQFGWE